MLGLGILSCAALVAVIGYHMVRPNFREMRASMAHLMPDPPESQAPKQVFSLRNLIFSPRFWLRLICVGLVALAVFPLSFTILEPAGEQDRHYRIVLDVSGSMAIVSNGERRLDLAVVAARAALAEMRNDTAACVDMIVADQPMHTISAEQIEAELATLEPAVTSQGVDVLARALGQLGPCGDMPTHAVVVSDLPAQIVPEERYSGHLTWHQVGLPADNFAIWDVTVTAGALYSRAPEMTIRVAGFGDPAGAVSVAVEGPGGRSEIALRRDEARAGGWVEAIPYKGAGTYRLTLIEGGALTLDDAVVVELGALDRVAVDWKLSDVPRPGRLVGAQEGLRTIVVAPYTGQTMALPEGPFVLTYPGWPNATPAQIGPFMKDHPVLRGVNFDVFEANAPRTIAAGKEFRAIIRPDAAIGVWLAERDGSRGLILPHPLPQGSSDVRVLAKLMFYNGLSWVAQGAVPSAPALRYVGKAGDLVPDARAESDTARPLAPPPDLAVLAEPPLARSAEGAVERGKTADWMPWLFALALLVMLVERVIGLVWSVRRRGDV